MAIREGRWDCQYCGTKGNLGRDKSCGNCGRSRPEGTKFYLPEGAEEVTDQRLIEQAESGPDWVCAFCASSNKSDATSCGSCGAAREATSVKQEVKTYGLDEVPTTGDMDFDTPPTAPKPVEKKSRALPFTIIGAVAVVLCIGFILIFFVLRKDAPSTVEGFEWERTVDVEAYRTVTEEDWEVPTGGRILSERQEVHHEEQILDRVETREEVCGKIDQGNGLFTDKICVTEEEIYRSEPVYQPFYTYEIDKWIVIRTLQDGARDHSPFWPRADLEEGEREGERHETYTVIFKDSEGKIRKHEVSLQEWQTFEVNQEVTLKLNPLGGITGIEK